MNVRNWFASLGMSLVAAMSLGAALPTPLVAPAAAASCSVSSGSVIRPSIYSAFGVGNANCGRNGVCVTTTLYRGNRAIASGRRCGGGNVQVSTNWVNSNPRDGLWAGVQGIPMA